MVTPGREPIVGLQRLVDSLAARLGRPVVVDDVDLRPLAHSPQPPDATDRVRTVSILSREAPPEAVAYLRDQGVTSDAGPDAIRIPANREIGLDARLCQPVTDEDRTIGFLWIIEGDTALGPEETDLVVDVAAAVGDVISRHGSKAAEFQMRARVSDLLSDDPAISCDAAAALLDAGAFDEGASAAALVALAVPPAGDAVDATVSVLLSRGLRGFEREVAGRHLAVARADEAVVLVGHEDQRWLEDHLEDLANTLREELEEVTHQEDWGIAIGIGSIVKSLAGAPLSYKEAAQAATVAARVPQVPDVLAWADIGIYRLLVPPDTHEQDTAVIPRAIRELLDRPSSEMLLHTLETYLDLAGDAQATAAALYLARGSLYYRLHRIEEIAGVDLRSGHDRLTLHLGLKLARIIGAYPLTATGDGAYAAQPARVA